MLPLYARMGCAVVLMALLAPALPASDAEPVYHSKTLRGWIADLKDPDAATRLDAADELADVGAKARAVVPALLLAATDKEDEVRAAVLHALIQIDPKAEGLLPVLFVAMKDRCPEVREAAVHGLRGLDPNANGVLPALAAGAKDPCDNVRQSAVGGLGAAGKPAIPCLCEALNDESEIVRVLAASALLRMGDDALALVPELAAALKDARVRHFVMRYMDKPDSMGVPFLLEALKEGNEELRNDAAQMVAEGGDAGVPIVLDLLKHKDPKIRQLGASAFPQNASENPAAVHQLGKALGDEDATVREHALSSLYWLGKKARVAVPDLARFLRVTEDDDQRTLAARCLCHIGWEATPAMLLLLKDEEACVRLTVVAHLPVTADNAETFLPALIDRLGDDDPKVRRAAIQTLDELGPAAKGATAALTLSLEDTHAGVRGYAARALGSIGPGAKQAVPRLTQALKHDADKQCRSAAAVALSRIGKDAGPVLWDLVKDQKGLFDADLAMAVVRQGDPQAVPIPVWLEALRSVDRPDWICVSRSLSRCGKDIVPPLVERLHDSDAKVRKRAAVILRLMPDGYVDVGVWLNALQAEDKDIREQAADALARWEQDPKVLAALGRALWEDPDESVRRVVAAGIGQFLKADVASVCAAWKKQPAKDRKLTMALLVEIGPAAHAALAEALADPDVAIRRAAADALRDCDRTYLPLLGVALRDRDLYVRFAVWRALRFRKSYRESSGNGDAVAALLAAVSAPEAETRVAAVFLMGEYRDGSHVRLLRRALKDPSVAVRRQATCALGRYPDPRSARLALTSALDDEDDLTRQLAAHALTQIDRAAAVRAGGE